MAPNRQSSAASLDAESLWQELIDSSFDVDEFLENYIKQSLISRPVRPADSDLSIYSPVIPRKTEASAPAAPTHSFALHGSSFIDVRAGGSYDTTRILRGLNDLFSACVFINSKAAYQHHHAEEELHNVEEEAKEQLLVRADKVRLNLQQVGELEDELKELSLKLTSVGDKISSITMPQERLIEAHRLLSFFVELDADVLGQLTYPELLQPRITLDDYQNAANTILGLHKIVTTIAVYRDDVYHLARQRILALYDEIEGDLVVLFARGHEQQPAIDLNLMQQIAVVLQNFPGGFSVAISAFVDRAVKSVANHSNDAFRHVIQVCDATYKLIYEVFPGPNAVMEKFITQVISHELEPLIQSSLASVPKTVANLEAYLHSLYDLYRRTKALEPALSKFKGLRMPQIIHMLFGYHLEGYMQMECRSLKTRCNALIQQYYDVMAGDFGVGKIPAVQVLSDHRDFFTLGAAKPIPAIIGDYLQSHPYVTYETKLISESLCLGVLHELRQAANRATTLIPSDDLGPCLQELGHIVITDVVMIHLDYGLAIGLRVLPSAEGKEEPNLSFLKLVSHSAVVFDLLTHQLHDCLRKIERFKPEAKKLEVGLQYGRDRIEKKASAGIETCLNAAMSYLRYLLSDQKKTEFSSYQNGPTNSPTAQKVSDFFTKLVQLVNETVTGKNHLTVSAELGLRFHRDIIDHFDEFRFNSEEAMILICDVKEYRDSALLLNIEPITKLFDEMLLLANLLVTKPHNLLTVCQEILREVDSLDSISYTLRLREDFRSISDSVSDYI